MDLRLLGPVHAVRDTTEISLGSARSTAVLCVLALDAGHAVSRDRLIHAVWGEDAPASAMGNVYTYVNALRRMLDGLIDSGGGTYRLNLPVESIDAHRFEALRETARRHRAAGDAEAELAAVRAAGALWRGDALAGVPGPFAEAHRLRLTELRIATAERHAALLTAADRHEEATDVLRALVTAYPGREDLRAMLAGALRPAWRQVPMTVTPFAGVPSLGPHRTHPEVERPSLIGRQHEIDRLRRIVADAAGGRGHSVRVEGPAGIGKSALLTVALRDAVPKQCLLGWVVGDELSGRAPLGLLLECVDSALAGTPARHLAAQLVTVAGDATHTAPEATVAEAVELVVRAAREAPLLLVADDLHWADPLTRQIWDELGRRTAEVPLVLVAAVRTGSAGAHALSVGEVLAVPALDPAAAAALVRAVAADPPEAPRLGRMVDEAGGNPYYLRHLAAGETVAGGLPAAVAAHLAPFGAGTREVLRAAAFLSAYELAVPGSQPVGCSRASLAAATDRTPADLSRELAPALAAGLLVTSGERVVFAHRVVARTLHEGTPAALRVPVHRSLGLRLAEAGAPPEEVVVQFLAGKVPFDTAIGAWLAEHVSRLAERAPMITLTVLHRAHAEPGLDPELQVPLTAWLARLLLRHERNAAVPAAWVAARTTDPQVEGEMLWIAARTHERRDEPETAAAIAHGALRAGRIAPEWTEQIRELLDRIRPRLPGDPTEPHIRRRPVVDGDR
ncbi:AAA family ATPase [Actinoplanes sp. HUAS TT8]|uniref:AAA family ATPase n=1 Tax=Actinoplanes sp. HUAS TT8 TaxID=3447453 RepID=UPI003F51D50E